MRQVFAKCAAKLSRVAKQALAASGSTLKTTARLAAGTYYLGVSTALEGPTQYNNNYQVTAKWLAS